MAPVGPVVHSCTHVGSHIGHRGGSPAYVDDPARVQLRGLIARRKQVQIHPSVADLAV